MSLNNCNLRVYDRFRSISEKSSSVEIILRSQFCFCDTLAASNRTEKEKALSLKYYLINSVEE